MRHKVRNNPGSIIPMAALLMSVIISFSALAIDMSYNGIVRSSLEKATESAAVAGAQEYFRNGADAGKAVNETIRIFKMNVSNDTMIGNYYSATGMGSPTTLTYSKTFTSGDNLRALFKQQPITLTIMTDLNRGKVTVTSAHTTKSYFAKLFTSNSMISITREAELPPYDVVFVVDLSGSMRFATVSTYIGTAYVQTQGMSGLGPLTTDVIITQSQYQPGIGTMITANGLVTTLSNITDVVINTPGTDIPATATYSSGKSIYINDPDRGFIVNHDMASGLRRIALTGYRINQLAALNVSGEDKQLAQTFNDNKSTNQAVVDNYFTRAASYIEPVASAIDGVSAFIDTVKIYGSAALKLGLVTFESSSYTADMTSNWYCSELEGGNVSKYMKRTLPYLSLVNPVNFDTVTNKLSIMATSGTGSFTNPIVTYSYPNGGTNINAGLTNAKYVFDKSDRPNSEKVIILFTDGEPTAHTFSALGQKVKSLTDAKIKIYSIVLTLAISQTTINNFKYQVETIGKAEPVIFINDPAKLKNAFLQIADDLGLKLVN
ncbi:MAG: VWA domain-containing protein [Candidatus Melainabacteria bacterium]|nr:VWA domain-containing protein [Candidatus Melainabacteria bacterium]